ncbi:MAG: response regulator [Candidatus Riflebacteria bacterium]|nr:response regulator [Candidatus Riflebacteria bacterium]
MKRVSGITSIPLQWLILLSSVATFLIFTGIFYYGHEADRITEEKFLELTTIAQLKVDSIQEWRKQKLADIHRAAVGPLVRMEIERLILEPANQSAVDQLKVQLSINRKGTVYEDAFFLDKSGKILLSDNADTFVGKVTLKAFEDAVKGCTSLLSDLFLAPDGNIYIDVLEPIQNNSGEIIAVVVLRSHAAEFLFPLIQKWPTPSRTGETLLVSRDGDSVVFLNELRHRKNTALNLKFPLTQLDLPAVQAVIGNYGRFIGLDYREVEVLSVSKLISQSNWSIVSKMDTSEILAEVKYRAWVTAIIIFLLILISSVLVISLYRKSQEEKVKKIEAIHRALVENIPQRIFLKDRDHKYLFVNANYSADFGLSPADFVGKDDYSFYPRELADKYRADDNAVISSGTIIDLEESYVANERSYWIHTIKTPIRNDRGEIVAVMGLFNDITDRKKAEEEKEKLNEKLLQSQKMESVGRLAGGVAHDFNNMLSVIIGYTELIIEKSGPDNTMNHDLEEILKAARRSADITSQLLAFSRQQTISPKPIDLNEAVNGMLNMLQRLIGENIKLVWHPEPDLWTVKIDSAQLDQVLTNLCVNARDAIADVGHITIETGRKIFDESSCGNLISCIPGDFVMLSVSDDGCGIDRETQMHLFEPFFTTKALGKGTGLGLATVYGIVKQNGGFVNVYSEPGQGATFRIYLPRYTALETDLLENKDNVIQSIVQVGETILLVEDDEMILKLTKTMLEDLGYVVVAAGTPSEAIGLASMHSGNIHLLITDVVMPEINGRDLAKQIQKSFPKLKVLFMSGYTANVIVNRGVLYEGVNFIQKPFSKKDLADKTREALSK